MTSPANDTSELTAYALGELQAHSSTSFAIADVDDDTVRPNEEFEAWVWVTDPASVSCPLNVAQLVRLARTAVAADGSPAALEAIARTWLHRFNTRDLEGLLALYADDAVHVSPKLRAREPATLGEIRGKAALRAWWADAMQRLPGLHYAERHLTAGGGRVFMEYERQNPGEAPYMVAEVLVLRGGLIVASTVYHG